MFAKNISYNNSNNSDVRATKAARTKKTLAPKETRARPTQHPKWASSQQNIGTVWLTCDPGATTVLLMEKVELDDVVTARGQLANCCSRPANWELRTRSHDSIKLAGPLTVRYVRIVSWCSSCLVTANHSSFTKQFFYVASGVKLAQ